MRTCPYTSYRDIGEAFCPRSDRLTDSDGKSQTRHGDNLRQKEIILANTPGRTFYRPQLHYHSTVLADTVRPNGAVKLATRGIGVCPFLDTLCLDVYSGYMAIRLTEA